MIVKLIMGGSSSRSCLTHGSYWVAFMVENVYECLHIWLMNGCLVGVGFNVHKDSVGWLV